MALSKRLCDSVRERAKYRCEYCQYPEILSTSPLSIDHIRIIGISPEGRATCNRLDLNDERRTDKFIQKSRENWIKGGFHPPLGSLRQQDEDAD